MLAPQVFAIMVTVSTEALASGGAEKTTPRLSAAATANSSGTSSWDHRAEMQRDACARCVGIEVLKEAEVVIVASLLHQTAVCCVAGAVSIASKYCVCKIKVLSWMGYADSWEMWITKSAESITKMLEEGVRLQSAGTVMLVMKAIERGPTMTSIQLHVASGKQLEKKKKYRKMECPLVLDAPVPLAQKTHAMRRHVRTCLVY